MASLFIGFWLRKTSLVNVGNPISDGIVFVFHLAWCVRGFQSLKRYWPYLIPLRAASRMVSLSNYCIWCLVFISNLMKSSVVYARLLDLRQWSDRVSVWYKLTELLKAFRHFLTAVIILAVKESFERFSCLEFIFKKKQTPGSRLNITSRTVLATKSWVSSWDRGLKVPYLSWILRSRGWGEATSHTFS